MDGDGRLLRSVNEPSGAFRARAIAATQPQLLAFPRIAALPALRPAKTNRRPPPSHGWLAFVEKQAARWQNGLGIFFSLMLIGSAGLYGAVRGGQYEAFVAANGTVSDAIARLFGFGITAITITSQGSLTEKAILDAAGVNPNSSLVFLDAAGIRNRLLALPVVADAQVRKLYPDRLVIEITERQPFALWQQDGQVHLVSENGNVIGDLNDSRYADLPFVAGDGANTRTKEFLTLLDALGDQKTKIRAGVYIGERRWNLKTTADVDIKLPEENPAEALKGLAEVERQSRILEKDILAVDLRVPGKIEVRLTESGMATRTEHLPKKKPRSDP